MLAVMNVGSTLYTCAGKPGIAEIKYTHGVWGAFHSTYFFFFFFGWGCLALSTGMGGLKYRFFAKV